MMGDDLRRDRKTTARRVVKAARRWQAHQPVDHADFDERLSEAAARLGLTLEEIEGQAASDTTRDGPKDGNS